MNTLEIKIGLDPEFMAKYKGKYIYPLLRGDNPVFKSMPADVLKSLLQELNKLSADEFGHCVEIRPIEANSGKQLVLNTIDTMAKLPSDFLYYGENSHCMDKAPFINLVRKLGRKELSESKNIYDQDILDDCPADLKARQAGKRLTFCGCHMHISAKRKVSITKDGVTLSENINVPLPEKALVALFDEFLFKPMSKDPGFKIGRYRSPGFYEKKSHGGFEYRSLGASALTPKRLLLIADIMKKVTEHVISIENVSEILFNKYGHKTVVSGLEFPKEICEMVDALSKTKPVKSDLRSLWVPF